MSLQLHFSLQLDSPAEVVWKYATSLQGINAEFWPYFALSLPGNIEKIGDIREEQVGTLVGYAPFWLCRWIPIDRMGFRPILIKKFHFIEESSLIFIKKWRHERRIFPFEEGCEISDDISLEPRIPGTGFLIIAFVRWIFHHRHARLKERWG